jgi:hypothetical protein
MGWHTLPTYAQPQQYSWPVIPEAARPPGEGVGLWLD